MLSQRGRSKPPTSNTALPMALPPSAKAPPRQRAETANPDTAMIASLVRISLSLLGRDRFWRNPADENAAGRNSPDRGRRHRAEARSGRQPYGCRDQSQPGQPQRGGASQDAG